MTSKLFEKFAGLLPLDKIFRQPRKLIGRPLKNLVEPLYVESGLLLIDMREIIASCHKWHNYIQWRVLCSISSTWPLLGILKMLFVLCTGLWYSEQKSVSKHKLASRATCCRWENVDSLKAFCLMKYLYYPPCFWLKYYLWRYGVDGVGSGWSFLYVNFGLKFQTQWCPRFFTELRYLTLMGKYLGSKIQHLRLYLGKRGSKSAKIELLK